MTRKKLERVLDAKRGKTQDELHVRLTEHQVRVLRAAAAHPRGHCPYQVEAGGKNQWGERREGFVTVRHDTTDRLAELLLIESGRDLSPGERADKDRETIHKTKEAVALMERGAWSEAHQALRELVDMTELRWEVVRRITAEGRAWLAARGKVRR
jgi:hypothetical protein